MRLIDIHLIPDTDSYKRGLMLHTKNVQELGGTHYYEQELVAFLLQNSSLALYVLAEPNNNPHPGFASLVLQAANLHKGHSEGKNTIIVQDVANRVGPWVLINTHNNQGFYLQNLTFPYASTPNFQSELDTPIKIKNRYVCFPYAPMEIFHAFIGQNYQFYDTKMPEDLYRKLTN